MWTHFWDMNSGGGRKEPYNHIYIEAPKEEAKVIFYNLFKHNPERVSCTCCGADYAISEEETLEEITAFQRGCGSGYVNAEGVEVPESEAWVPREGLRPGYKYTYFERQDTRFSFGNKYTTLEDYKKNKDIFIVYLADIKDEDRKGVVPEQGYVWKE